MNPYLTNVLHIGPELVRHFFVNVPVKLLDTPTQPGRFTTREVVAHLADWEPILLDRMVGAKDTPGCTKPAFDEGERARSMAYADSDPVAELGSWEGARSKTIQFLKGLEADDWQKTYTHPEAGPRTIEAQANMLLGHDLYHIAQLAEFVRQTVAAT